MIKRNKEELAIYNLDVKRVRLLFNEVRYLFLEKRTEIIYVILNLRLYGIICFSDIFNESNEQYVLINTEFTKIINWNLIEAKQIFLNNCKINKIPVVSNSYHLLGDYSRWDDELTLKHFISTDILKLLVKKIERKKYMIDAKNASEGGTEKFIDSKVIQIDKAGELKEIFLNDNLVFIFRNEEEKKSLECYNGRKNDNFFTCCQLYRKYIREDESELETTLLALKQEGLKIYLWGNYFENSEIQEALNKETSKNKNRKDGGFWKDFLGELYTDSYKEAITSMKFKHKNVNGIRVLQNTYSKLLNIKDGRRRTCYSPNKYMGTIWFFGACITVGAFVEDRYTIESFLQKMLVESGYEYRVVNCGAWEDVNRVLMNFTQFKTEDIIIVYTKSARYKGFPNISLERIYEKNNIPLNWANAHLHHCNHRVNEIIAKELLMEIIPDLYCHKDVENKHFKLTFDIKTVKKKLVREKYVNIHFHDLKEKYQKIGAIVMNCNPFTKGHRYLIETAAKQVELLIVFVVQENKSLFSFEERFEMVKEGVCDLSNVKVVPSGKYILSYTTFPEYFGKVESENLEIDIEYDLRLWGECVATVLGIHYRFVGEEKEDMVTAAYNCAMKKLLPFYGVSIIELPRVKSNGCYISASYVRKLLKNGQKEKAFSLVPSATKRLIESQL